MKGYKLKEFRKVLKSNGYELNRTRGDHYIYSKKNSNPIVIPHRNGSKELPRPLILRLIKDNKLVIE